MHLHQQIYSWLVNQQFITNEGQIDQNGEVSLPPKQCDSLENGYLIAKVIEKIASEKNVTLPKVFTSMKNDISKSTKTNNWNFVWLTFSSIGLKFDLRIKELILKGQSSLIVEVLKQLYEHDTSPKSSQKIPIKQKVINKSKHNNPVDIKKININKDPQFCQNSLEFLLLLLKTSLSINVEQILGLLTNQYKYLAQIIVKGINDNFDPIILFYSLLNKYKSKLNQLMQGDLLNEQAFLLALKAGFVSKNKKVVELTIQLFGDLKNIYNSFSKLQSGCLRSLLLGIKRHSQLRKRYWLLLSGIIQNKELEFFSKYYFNSFQNIIETIEITTFIIEFIPQSQFKNILIEEDIVLNWIRSIFSFSQSDIQAQVIAFKFIGKIMLYIPEIILKNQWVFDILTRNWQKRSLGGFAVLFNEMIQLLDQLGKKKNPLARRIYIEIIQIARVVGHGDKRDYLIQNFMPLVSQFKSIPCQNMINQIKGQQLSTSEFNLVCQSIENTENTVTLFELCKHLKDLFLSNKILNFYCVVLIKQIIKQLLQKEQDIQHLILPFLEETMHQYAQLEIKYKSKPIQKPTISFGSSSRVIINSKQDHQQHKIKDKEKQLCLILTKSLVNFILECKNDKMRDQACNSILKINNFIKAHNHKTGSKQLKSLLMKKFKLVEKNVDEYQSSQQKSLPVSIKNSKVELKSSPTTEEIRKMQYQVRYKEEMEQFNMERKKAKDNVSLINLTKGQVTQCQIAQYDSLQNIVHPSKEINLISKFELQQNQLQIIECLLKKYHRVLTHLFWLYADTLYSPDNVELIQDNIKRKEILSVAELTKLLKDYKKYYLTSQTEISQTIREINVKLLGKRTVNQLDFQGFEQYIVHFCYNNMTIPHQITTTTTIAKSNSKIIGSQKQKKLKKLKNEPIQIIMEEFFAQLKQTFKSKKQNVAIFEDFQDIQLTKDQIQYINQLNTNLQTNQNYILPSGYKKMPQYKFEYSHQIKNEFGKIPEAYEAALEALSDIFFKSQLKMHLVESIFEKKTIFKAKPTTYILKGQQNNKKRSMSTSLNKNPSLLTDKQKNYSNGVQKSKQIPSDDRQIGQAVAQVLEQMIQTASKNKLQKTIKISEPKRRAISTSKMLEMNKRREQFQQKKKKDKQQKQQQLNKKKKQQQQKKREKLQLFLESQRLKLMQKKRLEQQKKETEIREKQKKKAITSELNEKFKSFNQQQIKRIKQIETDAISKIKNQQQQLIREQENKKKQSLLRKQKIQTQTKNIIETKNQVQQNFANLFRSQPIKNTFNTYEPNIRATFEFIINSTNKKITSNEQKEELIFEGWKYFMKVFDLSPLLVQPNEMVLIFKNLTKNKLVPKQLSAGLNYEDFKEALFQIAARYKGFFNFINSKIIQKNRTENSQFQKNEKSEVDINTKEKDEQQKNEFQKNSEIDIGKLMKENSEGKSQLNQYGDLSLVNSQTLKGLIYYLKVPNNRQGQIERFKNLNVDKRLGSLTIEKRLKGKLSEQYTLNVSPKKNKKEAHNKKNIPDKSNTQVKKSQD